MSRLKEISDNVLAADALVLAVPQVAASTTIFQEVLLNTVVTVPSNVLKVNVKFTNVIPARDDVRYTISVGNIENVAVGTELVFYIELSGLDTGSANIQLSNSDFVYTQCGVPRNHILFNTQYLVLSFLFDGTVFVNTNDVC
jgi:hypothetical protein